MRGLYICMLSMFMCSGIWAGGRSLPQGGAHVEYDQWLDFCSREPEDCRIKRAPDFVVTQERLRELSAVNQEVNGKIKPMDDMAQYGVSDYWSLPYSGYGDCEDYALLKRHLLLERGWPSSRLLMSFVELGRDGHMILLVDVGDRTVVLDNLNNELTPWDEVRYQYLARQSHANPNVWIDMMTVDVVIAMHAPPPSPSH